MASKKSFAEWSEDKQRKDNKTVNGKTFAQWTRDNAREAAVEDYVATTIPRSAEYLDVTNDISRTARNAPVEQRKREIAEDTVARKYGTTVIPHSADYLNTTNKLMQLAMDTVDADIYDRYQAAEKYGIGTMRPGYGYGNIDLNDRPMYKNPDGSISTVDSFSTNIDGREVLLPQIGRDAQGNAVRWTEDQAIDNYLKTGENLGTFKTPEEATAYAEWIHNQQAEDLEKRRNDLITQIKVTDKKIEAAKRDANTRTTMQERANLSGLANTAAREEAQAYMDDRYAKVKELQEQRASLMDQLHAAGGKYGVGDFVGDALDALQAGLQTPLTTLEKADYWLSVKLGLVDRNDKNEYALAHALENDIAQQAEAAMSGRNDLGRTAIGVFQSAGNVLGSTAFAYATGIPQGAQQLLGPVAANLSATEAGLGANAGQRAIAGASRFAGNLLGDVVANPTNAVISAQSGIGAYDRAKTAGASDSTAFAAGIANAAAEYLSNKMFSGTPLLDSPEEKGYVVELIEAAAEKAGTSGAVSKLFSNGLVNFVFDKSGEGLEEVITGVLDPLIEKLTYNPDADLATASDLFDEYIGGVAMSLLLGAAEPITNFQGRKAEARAAEAARAAANAGMGGMTLENAARELQRSGNNVSVEDLRPSYDRGVETLNRAAKTFGVETEGKSGPQIRADVDAAIDSEIEKAKSRPMTQQQALDMVLDENANMGETGKKYAREIFRLTQGENGNALDFYRSFDAVYQAARRGETAADVMSRYSDTLTPQARQVAYNAGVEDMAASQQTTAAQTAERDTYTVTPNDSGRYAVTVRDAQTGAEYSGGVYDTQAEADQVVNEFKKQMEGVTVNVESGTENADGGARVPEREGRGGVRGRAETASEWRAARQRAAEDIRNSVYAAEDGEEVSNREAGISGGTDEKSMRLVRKFENDETRGIKADAAKKGVNVVFFLGEIRAMKGGKKIAARGEYSADGKTFYIALDDPDFTARQIYDHEDFHERSHSDAELQEIAENIINSHSAAELREMVAAYVNAYGWTDMSNEDIVQEILADAYAGIDIFMGRDVFEGATRFTEDVRGVVKGREGEQQKERGPPAEGIESFGETSKNARFSEKQTEYSEEEKRQHADAAIKHFGKTYSWKETGWLTQTGDRIDFSGKHDGAPGGYRTVDHRDISDALGLDYGGNDYSGALFQFMSEGNIRISPENGGINLMTEPTEQQYARLRDFIERNRGEVMLDVDNADGVPVKSMEWSRGTRADTVIKAIKNYFAEGDHYESPFAQFRYSQKITSQQDADYAAAVDRGDMETAQRMVDEAAEAAFADSKVRTPDGKLMRVYHGTKADFTVFDTKGHGGTNGTAEGFGIYLTDSTEVSKAYGDRQITGYADIKRPAYADQKTIKRAELARLIKETCVREAQQMVNDGDYDSINDALRDTWVSNYVLTYEYPSMQSVYSELAEQIIRREDNDADVIYEVMNGQGIRDYDRAMDFYHDVLTPTTGIDGIWQVWKAKGQGTDANVILAFDSAQIKSADPVTYDDNGNVIPLSERFNPENEDIRYSQKLTAEDELRRQNDTLQKRVEYWKGQTKRTTVQTARADDAVKAARQIVKDYDSEADAKEIGAALKDLTDYIMRGENITYAEVKDRAVEIARELVENAKTLRDGDGETFREVRDALQKPLIISAQDAHDVTPDGWGDFRNSIRSKVNISINGKGTPIDTAYAELSDRFPSLFPAEIAHPADQLQHMIDVIDELTPVYDNPFSYNMAEAIEYAANDIIDRVFGDDIRMNPPTFADKAAEKLAAEKARGSERVAEVREQKNAQIADLKARNAWATAQRIAEVKKQRDAQLAALKEHYAEAKKTASEKKADSAARTRLLKIVKRLQNKKLPAVSRALLEQYIGNLDTVAKSITGNTIMDLNRLRAWYDDQKTNNPDFIPDAATEAKIARLSQTQISDLTPTQVAELTEALLNIENEINTQRRLIESEDKRDTRQMVLESLYNVEETKGSKKNAADWLVTNTLSPERLVKRLTGYAETDPLLMRTKDLAEGQRKMFDYQRRAEARFSKWANDKKLMDRLRSKERVKITGYSHGRAVEVEITPDMRMALYLHSLNEENMKHIANGGVTIPDIEIYLKGDIGEAYSRGKTIKLSPSNVRSIAAGMSAEERAYAKAAHDYFNGMSKDEINAVSEKLVGYSIAGVDDYFPIETDKNFTKSDIAELKRDGTIEGMGFLKERQHASNAIYLVPLTDVLNKSIQNHAKYVGMAMPVRNFSKIWGMNAHNDAAGEDNGLRQAIGQKWGERGIKAVERIISDVQNPSRSEDGKLLAKIRSNYAGAVLTLNASVALKQAASYPTAAAVLGWEPLIKAMGNVGAVDLDLINKYTPLQWYRSKGYSTQELGDIRSKGGVMDKVLSASIKTKNGREIPLLNWIQGIDLATTRKLWKASEYYVQQHNADLPRGTDAYYKAVADIYNKTIELTQPNYTTMQRPQILRSSNQLLQSLVMFKTQPFQNFNILYDAIGELRAAERAAKNGDSSRLTQAKKNAVNAVSSNLVSAVVFAAMTMAWAYARRKKDKYEDKEGNFNPWAQLGKDVLSSEFGMIPFGSDAYNLFASWVFGEKYYGMSNITADSISGALDATKKAVDTLSKTVNALLDDNETTTADPETVAKELFDCAKDLSKIAGVPLENVVNLVTAVYTNVASAVNGEYITGYEILRNTKNMESSYNKSAAYDMLYKAKNQDMVQYNELRRMMIENGFKEKNIDAAMKKRDEKK